MRERFRVFEKQKLVIELDNPHCTVSFFEREESKANKQQPDIIAQVDSIFSVNEKINSVLSDIENRRLPTETIITENIKVKLDSEGLLKEDAFLPFSALPDYAQDCFNQINYDLNEIKKKVLGLIKWKCNLLGEYHSPFYSGSLLYSRDRVKWHKFHPDIHIKLLFGQMTPIQPITQSFANDIRTLYLSGRYEPLSRQLYREASLQRKDAPRSALVIVVTAIEAGLKESIIRLQPEVRWLLQELPSPPLEKLLENYWPKIPNKKRFGGKEIVFPKDKDKDKDIVNQIKKAVGLRNKLVHGWDKTIDWQWLEEFFSLAHDMLWIFDYATDVEWALTYVREKTLQKCLR